MKILVMSDSHGAKRALINAYAGVLPDLTVHLGDHDSDCAELQAAYPDAYIRAVRGNGDRRHDNLDIDEFTFSGLRVFMTHGHLFGVKSGLAALIDNARTRDAGLVLFGHTHNTYDAAYGGMRIINPGSIGMGKKTFAVLDIQRGEVNCEFISVKRL